MNEPLLDQLFAGYIQGTLNEAQAAMLYQYLIEHPDAIDDLTSERTVDASLNLATNKTGNENFVERMLAALDDLQQERKSHNNGDTRRSLTPPPFDPSRVLNHAEPSDSLSRTHIEPLVIDVGRNEPGSKFLVRPKRKRRHLLAWTASAAAVLALAIVGVFWQTNLNDNVTDSDNQTTAVADSNAASSTNELNDSIEVSDHIAAENNNDAKGITDFPAIGENQLTDKSSVNSRDVAQDAPKENSSDNSGNSTNSANNSVAKNPDGDNSGTKNSGTMSSGMMDSTNANPRVAHSETTNTTIQAPKISTTKSLRWLNRPESEDGFGVYSFNRGTAEIELADGSRIQVAGPAEVELKPEDMVYVKHGMITANVADESALQIETPFTQLVNSASAHLQMSVGDSGLSEIMLSEGRIELTPRGSVQNENPDNPLENPLESKQVLKMDAKGLNQVIAQAVDLTPRDSDSPFIPFVFMAQGNGGFRGHVNIDGNSVTLDQPESFARLVQQIAASNTQDTAEFSNRWRDFVKQFDEFQSQTFNRFDEADFNRFFDTFKEQYVRPQGNSQNFGDVTSSSTTSFDGVINVGGREMRFTSPDEFERQRRRVFSQ